MRTFKDIRESAKGMVGGFSVEIPKQTISGKTIGGGKNGIFVKAKTARQAISMAAKRLGVDFKMLKVGKVIKESVETLDEAYQQFLDKSPSNWGEEKVVAYGTKKGYKVIGVCGHGKIDGIVLFGLDTSDKAYVGKEAKVKTGQTVFRYATRNSMAGDIFPLVKIDVKRGLLYNLSQKSSDGEIDHAEFETKSSKLRYLRLHKGANLRDITGFDPGFGSMKESTLIEAKQTPLEQMQDIVKNKQAKKIGGVMVDMFTASTITQAYAKVNPAIKAKMEKSSLDMLVGLAQKMMGMKESVQEGTLDEAMGKLNAKGEIEMTTKNYSKVHKDYKTKIKGTPYAMQIDPKTGGSALFPVKFIKESANLEEGKMKEFHAMVKKGMTAAQIAKKIGMKEKDVAEFMKGMKV